MKFLTAQKIADMVNGSIVGDPNVIVRSVSKLADATEEQVSVVGNKKDSHQLTNARAGVVIVPQDLAKTPTTAKALVACDNVDLSFNKIVMFFAPAEPIPPLGVHPSAVIAPTAKLGKNVSIGANAVIDEGAEIGDDTFIGAGTYVGVDVKIGWKCKIYPNVTIMYRCQIGNMVTLHPGVVIGGDGFGFVAGPKGLVKVPQTGIVRIDDDVEIGANTTVDRARFGVTWIKSNVKIDNQVMVAHNVVIGESSILVAQCGVAGSAELGRGVIMGAKSGINGHITIGDGVQVAGTSGVQKSLPAGAIAVGTPAETQREFMTRLTLPKKVERLQGKIDELKAEIAALQAKLS